MEAKETMRISLDGAWRLAQAKDGGSGWLTAVVPGEIHYDLERAGRLPSIYSSRAAAENGRWVAEEDWIYEKSFDVSAEFLERPNRFLCLDSVDTYADVELNGERVGITDNMFIRYRFALRDGLLKREDNLLRIYIKSHRRMVADRAERSVNTSGLDGSEDFAQVRSLVRRYQRNFSTDLLGYGCYVMGIGIPRSVYLAGEPESYIEDFVFRTLSADEASAEVALSITLHHAAKGMTVRVELEEGGRLALNQLCPVSGGCVDSKLHLEAPRLWWPNGSGKESHRYFLRMVLLDGERELSRVVRRVGIRSVELVEKENGSDTFYLKINGIKTYIYGCNYMPADYLTGTGTARQNLRLLRLAKEAGCNMIRLWGGGTNESEEFYSLCDEMGLMVWKEMHLHSHTYPDFDSVFMKQTQEEAKETILYLRNHPCFAVICGGNEQQEGWHAWHWKESVDRFYGERLLYEVYPAVAREFCPEIPYVSNSPHGKFFAQSPVDGDTHSWGDFYNATKDPQFVCETRWFSGAGPKIETLEEYWGEDVHKMTGRGWHKALRERTGQELISTHYYSEYYQEGSMEEYLHSLELEQYLSDYHALYYLRSRSPSCYGLIYWPLNAGGPFMYLGSVDYAGRQQMSYDLLRRLFHPQAIHIYRDVSDVRIMGSNTTEKEYTAKLVVTRYTGSTAAERKEYPVTVAPFTNTCCLHTLAGEYGKIRDRRREVIHAALIKDGAVVSEDTLFFCPWVEFQNETGELSASLKRVADNRWELTVESATFAKMIELDLGAVKAYWSDNNFTLPPSVPRTVCFELEEGESWEQAVLRVRSLDAGTVKLDLNGRRVQ